MNGLSPRQGLCYVAHHPRRGRSKRPAGHQPRNPTIARRARPRAPELRAASRLLPQVPAPPGLVTSANPRPGLGRGTRGRGPGPREARPRTSRDYISRGASAAAAAASAGAATSPGSRALDFHSCVRRAEPESRPEAELGI